MTRLKEIREENVSKEKCSLTGKNCLRYKRGLKRPSCLLYLISQDNLETIRQALADCTGLTVLANIAAPR